MPHSVSSEALESDSDAVDMIADVGVNSITLAIENRDGDNDTAMVEADTQDGEGALATDSNGHEKQEVKLEDLFADVESDEEFPSSSAHDVKMSSSPEPPASPL